MPTLTIKTLDIIDGNESSRSVSDAPTWLGDILENAQEYFESPTAILQCVEYADRVLVYILHGEDIVDPEHVATLLPVYPALTRQELKEQIGQIMATLLVAGFACVLAGDDPWDQRTGRFA